MKNQELTLDIYIISRLTHIYYTAELKKLGITMGQFPFIMGIHENSGISQEKLSSILRISKSTTAVIIGQLIAKGVVQRIIDSSDRRNFRLSLTPNGTALIPLIEGIIAQCHSLIMEELPEGKKKMLAELLRRVRETAEKKFCNS